MSATSQKTAQQAEQDRLTSYLQGQTPASTETSPSPATAVSDARLSGQQGGAPGDPFQSDLSSKLGQASVDAKKRIAALAAVGSYGGSFGGLDNTVSQAFQKSGQGIDLANDFRKGDLAVYNTQQNVNPLTYLTPSRRSPLADQALSFGSQNSTRCWPVGEGLTATIGLRVKTAATAARACRWRHLAKGISAIPRQMKARALAAQVRPPGYATKLSADQPGEQTSHRRPKPKPNGCGLAR